MGISSCTGPNARKELLTVPLGGEVECVGSQLVPVP